MKTEKKSTGFFLKPSKMEGYKDAFRGVVMNGLDAESPKYPVEELKRRRKSAIAAACDSPQMAGLAFCSNETKIDYAKWCICQIAECSSFWRISPLVLRDISFILRASARFKHI